MKSCEMLRDCRYNFEEEMIMIELNCVCRECLLMKNMSKSVRTNCSRKNIVKVECVHLA